MAEVQRVGNPELPSKLQNSSAKVSRNSRKTFAEKKTKLAWVLGADQWTCSVFFASWRALMHLLPHVSRENVQVGYF